MESLDNHKVLPIRLEGKPILAPPRQCRQSISLIAYCFIEKIYGDTSALDPLYALRVFFQRGSDIPESSFSKREVMGSDIPSRAKLFASAASLNK
jgi:hypothetical protein